MNYQTIRNTDDYVRDTLSNDCEFILKAVKQLIHGVCCNDDEMKLCIWDLLPKINEALQEHIAFEEKWVFPKLSIKECKKHEFQHQELRKLLALTSWELECGYGEQFKTLAKTLLQALEDHHRNSPTVSHENVKYSKECLQDDDLTKIRQRYGLPLDLINAG